MTQPSVRQLAWAVCRDVNRTLGGGFAAMELLRRSFSQRGWLDASGNALLIAVSRLTPGTNVLAYCVALGWRLQGAKGSVAALVAGSLPASIIVVLVSATLGQVDRYRVVRGLLAVGTIVAVALVFSGAWHLLRPYLTRARWRLATTVMLISTGLLVLDMTPVRILIVAAAVGGLWRVREDPT